MLFFFFFSASLIYHNINLIILVCLLFLLFYMYRHQKCALLNRFNLLIGTLRCHRVLYSIVTMHTTIDYLSIF